MIHSYKRSAGDQVSSKRKFVSQQTQPSYPTGPSMRLWKSPKFEK